jgi:hypothetical protein
MRKLFLIAWILSIVVIITNSQTPGELKVTFKTSATSVPTYAPRNIVACWVVNSNNQFVKTLLSYASERRQYLAAWKSATTLAGSAYNTTDAITGATVSSHATRTCTWNGKNLAGALLADGTYTVKMECTDNDGNRQNLASFTFNKGTVVHSQTPAATNGFSSISIEWTPINTAVENVAEQSFKIFTDSDEKFLNIQGDGFKRATIYNLAGKTLLSSAESKIRIQKLSAGTYFVLVESSLGSFSHKFIKSKQM